LKKSEQIGNLRGRKKKGGIEGIREVKKRKASTLEGKGGDEASKLSRRRRCG